MKFAVISDIHGNLSALKAVLQTIEVDHIYCLGDMIAIGPQPNEVLDLLFSLPHISMITGNHEENVLALIHGESHQPCHPNALIHHEWLAKELDPFFVKKLGQLPRFIRTNKTIFIHYHVALNKLASPIREEPFSPIVEPTLENMNNLFQDYDEKFIFFGHHHPQHFFQSITTYINPGSLGCNDGLASYAIVSENEISIKQIPYDQTSLKSAFQKTKMPHVTFFASEFMGIKL